MRERLPLVFLGWDMAERKSQGVKGRKSPGGRVARKRSAPPVGEMEEESGSAKPIRNIRKHADREVRKAFPVICSGLIEKAKAGALGQTQLLIKISGLDEEPVRGRRRSKTLSAMLMAELERVKASPEGAVREATEQRGESSEQGPVDE